VALGTDIVGPLAGEVPGVHDFLRLPLVWKLPMIAHMIARRSVAANAGDSQNILAFVIAIDSAGSECEPGVVAVQTARGRRSSEVRRAINVNSG
jgi:hypothetical protein